MPGKLRNRFVVAFVLLALIPYSLIQIYQFWKVERIMETNVSRLNETTLSQLANDFNDLKSRVTMAMLMLEKEKTVSLLREPSGRDNAERTEMIEARFADMQRYIGASDEVTLTMLDPYGGIYSTLGQGHGVTYDHVARESGFVGMRQEQATYRWQIHENTTNGRNSMLLSLYTLFEDTSGDVYGMLRISIDYEAWLRTNAKELSSGQTYYIVDRKGTVLASTGANSALSQAAKTLIGIGAADDYRIDKKSASLVNAIPVSSMDWHLVSQFALGRFFGDLQAIRQQFLATFLLITVVFVLVTYWISYSITRPLLQLQHKMTQMVKRNLKLQLPENRHKGEILALNQAFNRMVGDIQELLQRLKQEEKQREAVHSQMLISQINPHFLFNTLNTVKWIALDRGVEPIYSICLSLGKLLETSLNSEVELIRLRGEIELVRAFVDIQKFRFGERLKVDYQVEPATMDALVPKLSLQPLVENAIRHGVAHLERGGVITVRSYICDGQLRLEVEDNGVGFAASETNDAARTHKGIGLANIRQRLQLLYKDKARFELLPVRQGACACLMTPLVLDYPEGGENSADMDVNDRGR